MSLANMLESVRGTLQGTNTLHRILQQPDNNNGSNNPNAGGSNVYEFVAFLLWYIFLVLCCVIPTCCAYRRRRQMEQRFVLQQASMHRIQQNGNLFILSNLQQRHTQVRRLNSERVQQERLRILTDELKGTTMVRSLSLFVLGWILISSERGICGGVLLKLIHCQSLTVYASMVLPIL